MKIHAKIRKWGNGLGLRVSGVLRDLPQFEENSLVDIEVTEEGFRVSKAKQQQAFFSEAELLHNLTKTNVQADLLASPHDGEY